MNTSSRGTSHSSHGNADFTAGIKSILAGDSDNASRHSSPNQLGPHFAEMVWKSWWAERWR